MIEAARTEPKQIPDEATPGDRHETLVSLAASMWGKGLDKAAVLAAIRRHLPDFEIAYDVDPARVYLTARFRVRRPMVSPSSFSAAGRTYTSAKSVW
mgnify:CR=1 FL=1